MNMTEMSFTRGGSNENTNNFPMGHWPNWYYPNASDPSMQHMGPVMIKGSSLRLHNKPDAKERHSSKAKLNHNSSWNKGTLSTKGKHSCSAYSISRYSGRYYPTRVISGTNLTLSSVSSQIETPMVIKKPFTVLRSGLEHNDTSDRVAVRPTPGSASTSTTPRSTESKSASECSESALINRTDRYVKYLMSKQQGTARPPKSASSSGPFNNRCWKPV